MFSVKDHSVAPDIATTCFRRGSPLCGWLSKDSSSKMHVLPPVALTVDQDPSLTIFVGCRKRYCIHGNPDVLQTMNSQALVYANFDANVLWYRITS